MSVPFNDRLAPSVLLWPHGTCSGEADVVFRRLAATKRASEQLHMSLFLLEKLGGRSHLGITLFVVFSGVWSSLEVLLGQAIFAAIIHRNYAGSKRSFTESFHKGLQAMLWSSVIIL